MDRSGASTRVDETLPGTGSRAADSDRDRIYRIAVAGLFGGDTRQITERYELRKRIGAGGLGVVYRAYDAHLGRDVALKFLRRSSTQRASAQMQREAKILARLSHPCIVPIFDLATIDGEQVITMELIDGETLDRRLAQGLSSSELLRIMRDIGDGLAAAHRAGVVHGDVKPGNVMIDHDGRVRLLDFGLARDVEQEVTGETGASSRGSHPSGTAGFLAPERFEDVVEPASDQFSFCVMLYFAAFGRPPLPAVVARPTAASIAAIDYGRPSPGRPRVPRWLIDVVRKGLSERPGDRFSSMSELLLALRRPARWPTALGLVGAVVAATTTVVALRSDPCELSAAAVGDIRLDVIARAPGASRGAIEDAISGFQNEWSKARDAACRATDPVELALHGACLDRVAVSVDQVLRETSEPGFDEWPVVGAVIGEVGRVSACNDAEALLNFSQDADPDVADAIQRGIDRAYASFLFGDSAGYLEQLLELSESRADVERAPYASLWLASHLGSALTMRERPREALTVLRNALVEAQRGPRWRLVEGALHAYVAEASAVEGHTDDAVFHAKQAVATLDGSPRSSELQHRAYRVLAIAELARGDAGAALAALDLAAVKSPPRSHRAGVIGAHGTADLAVAIADAAVANLRGLALTDLGRVEEAETSYRGALEVLGALSGRQVVLAQIKHNLGHLVAARGDLDEAREMLRDAYGLKHELGLLGGAAASAMDLGNLEAANGRTDAALEWFGRALEADVPSEMKADAKFNRAILLQQMGRQADALTDYGEVIHVAARTPAAVRRRHGARIGRGTALLQLDRSDEARRELEQALATEPSDAVAYDRAELRLALARALVGESPERAFDLAREAQALATAAGATALADEASRWLTTKSAAR